MMFFSFLSRFCAMNAARSSGRSFTRMPGGVEIVHDRLADVGVRRVAVVVARVEATGVPRLGQEPLGARGDRRRWSGGCQKTSNV